MKPHVLLWVACVALIAFLGAVGPADPTLLVKTISSIAGASVVALGFALLSKALSPANTKSLRPGGKAPHPLEFIWTSVSMAISTIFLSLTMDETLTRLGLKIPYGVLILTPICAVVLWLYLDSGEDADSKLKLRFGGVRSRTLTLILVLVFGLLVGFAAEMTRSFM